MKRLYDGMTPEQRALAQRENRGLLRFLAAFLLTCLYGVAAFFAVWALKDALPVLLLRLFPPVGDGDPARLYVAVSILVGGLSLLVTFFLLWFRLNRAEAGWARKFRLLALYCLGAGAVIALCRVLERLAA